MEEKKKQDEGYRVDYADFSEQVRDFTQSLSVLLLAGHGAVMSAGEMITEALKRTVTCGVREEAHFSCWGLSEALMRRLEGTPREGAEAEGVPRLMPGGAGQQTAPQAVVEA